MKTLETKRLILRRFELDDANDVLQYLKEPRVNCFMDEKITSIQEANEVTRQRVENESNIAVVLKDTGKVIGELFCEFEKPDTYSVGWNFNGDYEGKGYASESAKEMINNLFKNKGARRLYAYIEDDNKSSQKLAEKMGMRQEGLFLDFISFITIDGTPHYENTYQYALLKKEWEKLN